MVSQHDSDDAYAKLDATVYDAFARRTISAATAASALAHLAFLLAPLILAGAFDASLRREMEVSATTATSRSFDVRIKRPRPRESEKEKSNKQKPAEGANVKHVSRFNSDVLKQQTSSIWDSIVYPRMARRMGWQGRVRIRATIAPDGSVVEARVIEGTGYGVLDEAALKGVRGHRWTPGDETETVITSFYFKLNDRE
ncbi:MAG: energy transducer TonB [Leptospirales bacterium]|jgi:TonB family protein